MALSMEEKILGIEPKEEAKAKENKNMFDVKAVWVVSKKGCGTSLMNGRMVHEMLDYNSKKLVETGKKVIEVGDTTFKLKK